MAYVEVLGKELVHTLIEDLCRKLDPKARIECSGKVESTDVLMVKFSTSPTISQLKSIFPSADDIQAFNSIILVKFLK